jgi:hypothetical protein
MACDFFYRGNLPDVLLQEKVLKWISEYHGERALLVQPRSEDEYSTEYDVSKSLQYPEGLTTLERRMYRRGHGIKRLQYPCNYYGVIPIHRWQLDENGQFVFDRSAEGRLVRLLKLPGALGLPPCDDLYINCYADVVVKEGGYDRIISSSLRFALLLRIINLRWFPGLKVGDDDNVYDEVAKVLQDSSLEETFKDVTMNYKKCWDRFEMEYDKYYQTRGAKKVRVGSEKRDQAKSIF